MLYRGVQKMAFRGGGGLDLIFTPHAHLCLGLMRVTCGTRVMLLSFGTRELSYISGIHFT